MSKIVQCGELQRARQNLTETTAAETASQAEFEAAEAVLEAATEKLNAAVRSAEEARRANVAATLIRHLHAGDDCPVCGQAVAVVPQLAAADDSAQRERAAELARKEHGRALARRDVAASSVRERAERRASLEKRSTELESQLVNAFAPPVSPRIEESVLEHLREIDQLWRARQELDRRLKDLEIALTEARGKAELAEQRNAAAASQQERLQRELAEAKDNLSDYEAKISSAGSNDPEEEMRRLKGAIAQLQAALETARKQQAEAQQVQAAAAQERAVAESQLAAAQTTAEEAGRSAAQAAGEAGFKSPEAAEQALLPAEALAQLDAEIRDHDQALHDVKTEIARLDATLQGVSLDQEQVAAAKRSLTDAEAEQARRSKESGGKQAELKALEEAVRKAAELRQEREGVAQRHGVTEELARELRADRFQQHLLDEAFQNLVLGASQRLRSLNDRYQLAFAEDSFVVLDQENSGERRSADTLSGGETFLVSLALALELSEQVQQAAGAIRLDSLFIDEGFGTLDPETLETVATAIESLVAGDRMIGVISHVRELYQRLPARLEVIPASAGSTVRFVPTD